VYAQISLLFGISRAELIFKSFYDIDSEKSLEEVEHVADSPANEETFDACFTPHL
jgi:hypothetical protein